MTTPGSCSQMYDRLTRTNNPVASGNLLYCIVKVTTDFHSSSSSPCSRRVLCLLSESQGRLRPRNADDVTGNGVVLFNKERHVIRQSRRRSQSRRSVHLGHVSRADPFAEQIAPP